jgi:hypothetical protein
MVGEDELAPERLAAAVRRAVETRPTALAVDTGGAVRTARVLMALLGASGAAVHDFAMPPGEDMIGR